MGLFWDPDKKHRWPPTIYVEKEGGCKAPLIFHWKATEDKNLEKICSQCGGQMDWRREITGRGRLGDVEEYVGRCLNHFSAR